MKGIIPEVIKTSGFVIILCLVSVVSFAVGDSPLSATVEKLILSQFLPGYWEIWAGGGADGFSFRDDGTVTVFLHDSTSYETTWQLNDAIESQSQEIWSHPQLVLQLGEETYGIHLGLDGLIIHGGEQISDIPWSFSLIYFEGGGGYIRPRQPDRSN